MLNKISLKVFNLANKIKETLKDEKGDGGIIASIIFAAIIIIAVVLIQGDIQDGFKTVASKWKTFLDTKTTTVFK